MDLGAARHRDEEKGVFVQGVAGGGRGVVGCCRDVAVSIPPVLFQTRSNLRKMKRNKLREGAGGAGGGKIKQKRLCSGGTIGPTDAEAAAEER